MTSLAFVRRAAVGWGLLLALGFVGPREAAADSWSLPAPEFEVEGQGLPRDQVLDRIDSLESRLGPLRGEARGAVQWRLAQLYISTDMIKHRRHALDLLDDVAEADPDNVESHWLWAELAASMDYHAAVRERMNDVLEQHPDNVEAAVVMGQAEFRLGIRRLDENRLREARRIWRRAVALDSTRADVWHGFSASALALGEYRATRRAAESLSRREPAPGLFMEAVAHLRLGDEEMAWVRFSEALEHATPAELSVFRMGQGFLSGDDLETIARAVIPRPQAFAVLREAGEDPQPGDELDWSLVLDHPVMRERVLAEWWTQFDQRPAQGYSTGELEYWARLVEADVLFGRPEENRRGWHTPAGEVWVRWGRPTSTYYDPGSAAGTSRLDALNAAGVRFPPDTYLPIGSPPIWVWTFRWPGTWISFLFSDASRSSTWTPSESSMRNLADLRAMVPIQLPRHVEPRPFELALSAVTFPRAGQDALVETYIGFEPTRYILDMASAEQQERLWFDDRDTLAVVDWSVTDLQGKQIDRVRRTLDARARLSNLLVPVERRLARDAHDPFLVSIGARLPAGRYRVAVEVSEPVTGARTSGNFVVTVADHMPGDLLEMSGLQLATAFRPGHPAPGLPPEFIKYAAAVIPAPGHRVPLDMTMLGVYFEVRNLATDRAGVSNFDVRYAIYRSDREIRDLAFQEKPDLEGLELVAPASMTFLQERSGLSPEGLVIKGIELDVGALEGGDYVLVVTIEDRISADSISRAAAFRISSR